MDNLKQFFSKVGVGLRHFWTWIKPYLIGSRFRCQYLFILLSQVRKR